MNAHTAPARGTWTLGPCHPALSWEEAAWKITDRRASQFDLEVVDAFPRSPYRRWAFVAKKGGANLRRDLP